MAGISKKRLLYVLGPFDRELRRKIRLVAVGGTAMTLLGLKASTKDIDFNIPVHADYKEFGSMYKKIRPGVEIDYYGANQIFSESLPEDYVDTARNYKAGFKNIEIKVLDPIDIVCSKISRGYETDMEDIKMCIRRYRITKDCIVRRAKQYSRAGSGSAFKSNLKWILDNMFPIEAKRGDERETVRS